MSIPMIAGYYPYTRGGVTYPPKKILEEIPDSLRINPYYRDNLIVLAGNEDAAKTLTNFDLHVHRSFDDAPEAIHRDAAHKMKHWMCLWALQEYGEFLWVDWDTVMLREPDDHFWSVCRAYQVPKFVRIENYWATVNCGIYYAHKSWIPQMKQSFNAEVSEPNDELLWVSVLPENVRQDPSFWWGQTILQIIDENDLSKVTTQTYFAHVSSLSFAETLRGLF